MNTQRREPPDGSTVFLDANILFYWVAGTPELDELRSRSAQLMQRVERGELAAVCGTCTLLDAMHKVSCSEAAMTFSLTRHNLVRHLRTHRDLLTDLSYHAALLDDVHDTGVAAVEVAREDVWLAPVIARRERLLMNDAIILAVMERLGIEWLATNDDDFDSVAGIRVWKPRDL